MARPISRFTCQACGAVHAKWGGRCDACGAWNTLVEESAPEAIPRGLGTGKASILDVASLSGQSETTARLATGTAELDRVLGGGLVAGSAVLLGGDPGIGKSTLLLQAIAAITRRGGRAIYVSGEESDEQVRLRAQRLKLSDVPVGLISATSVRDIVATLDDAEVPQVLVIDSIQTMYVDSLDSAPGSVAQVRTSAQELIRLAKRRGIILLLVGHVTKDGQIAGPRVLEHMVDAVLYFEGERGNQFRIVRAVKNRFGATDEIGVFSMTDSGLEEVVNPSGFFMTDRAEAIAGAAIFAGIEGTRPVLVEIEALVASTPLATPRRAVVGWDTARLAMVLAVLDARCGLALAGNDVYLNVAGGLKINEPAADLAVAAALVSSLTECAMPPRTVAFGEIGLSGEIRPVAKSEARLKEAAKLGFERALIPPAHGVPPSSMDFIEVARLQDLISVFGEPAARNALAR